MNDTRTENQMSPQEWMSRFAARIMEVQKWPEQVAMEYAQESFMDFHEMAAIYRDCPEDAADEDMSSWDDDDHE